MKGIYLKKNIGSWTGGHEAGHENCKYRYSLNRKGQKNPNGESKYYRNKEGQTIFHGIQKKM